MIFSGRRSVRGGRFGALALYLTFGRQPDRFPDCDDAVTPSLSASCPEVRRHAATLVPVVQTKTLLSALATGVTGLDKAYNEKELLSNTVQALQTQMRADRKTEAGVIYGKMYRDTGNNTRKITSIAEYTLPMALSDADTYYQAGTISSALIGLSKSPSGKFGFMRRRLQQAA
jgi:hypothetical protein